MKKNCNLIFQIEDDEILSSGINFESTEAIKKLLDSTKPFELFNVLRKLPQEAYLSISEFSLDKLGRKSHSSTTTEVFCKTLKNLQLEAIEENFKRMKDYKCYNWILVLNKRRLNDTKLTRSDLEIEVKSLEKEFTPLYQFIMKKIIRNYSV